MEIRRGMAELGRAAALKSAAVQWSETVTMAYDGRNGMVRFLVPFCATRPGRAFALPLSANLKALADYAANAVMQLMQDPERAIG